MFNPAGALSEPAQPAAHAKRVSMREQSRKVIGDALGEGGGHNAPQRIAEAAEAIEEAVFAKHPDEHKKEYRFKMRAVAQVLKGPRNELLRAAVLRGMVLADDVVNLEAKALQEQAKAAAAQMPPSPPKILTAPVLDDALGAMLPPASPSGPVAYRPPPSPSGQVADRSPLVVGAGPAVGAASSPAMPPASPAQAPAKSPVLDSLSPMTRLSPAMPGVARPPPPQPTPPPSQFTLAAQSLAPIYEQAAADLGVAQADEAAAPAMPPPAVPGEPAPPPPARLGEDVSESAPPMGAAFAHDADPAPPASSVPAARAATGAAKAPPPLSQEPAPPPGSESTLQGATAPVIDAKARVAELMPTHAWEPIAAPMPVVAAGGNAVEDDIGAAKHKALELLRSARGLAKARRAEGLPSPLRTQRRGLDGRLGACRSAGASAISGPEQPGEAVVAQHATNQAGEEVKALQRQLEDERDMAAARERALEEKIVQLEARSCSPMSPSGRMAASMATTLQQAEVEDLRRQLEEQHDAAAAREHMLEDRASRLDTERQQLEAKLLEQAAAAGDEAQSQLAEAQVRVAAGAREAADLRAQLEESQSEAERLKRDCSELHQERDNLRKQHEELITMCEANSENEDKRRSEVDDLNRQVQCLRAETAQLQRERDEVREAFANLEHEKASQHELTQLIERERDELTQQLAAETANAVAPMPLSSASDEEVHTLRTENAALLSKLEAARTSEAELRASRTEAVALEKELDAMRKLCAEEQAAMQRNERQSALAHQDEVRRLQLRTSTLQASMDSLNQEVVGLRKERRRVAADLLERSRALFADAPAVAPSPVAQAQREDAVSLPRRGLSMIFADSGSATAETSKVSNGVETSQASDVSSKKPGQDVAGLGASVLFGDTNVASRGSDSGLELKDASDGSVIIGAAQARYGKDSPQEVDAAAPLGRAAGVHSAQSTTNGTSTHELAQPPQLQVASSLFGDDAASSSVNATSHGANCGGVSDLFGDGCSSSPPHKDQANQQASGGILPHNVAGNSRLGGNQDELVPPAQPHTTSDLFGDGATPSTGDPMWCATGGGGVSELCSSGRPVSAGQSGDCVLEDCSRVGGIDRGVAQSLQPQTVSTLFDDGACHSSEHGDCVLEDGSPVGGIDHGVAQPLQPQTASTLFDDGTCRSSEHGDCVLEDGSRVGGIDHGVAQSLQPQTASTLFDDGACRSSEHGDCVLEDGSRVGGIDHGVAQSLQPQTVSTLFDDGACHSSEHGASPHGIDVARVSSLFSASSDSTAAQHSGASGTLLEPAPSILRTFADASCREEAVLAGGVLPPPSESPPCESRTAGGESSAPDAKDPATFPVPKTMSSLFADSDAPDNLWSSGGMCDDGEVSELFAGHPEAPIPRQSEPTPESFFDNTAPMSEAPNPPCTPGTSSVLFSVPEGATSDEVSATSIVGGGVGVASLFGDNDGGANRVGILDSSSRCDVAWSSDRDATANFTPSPKETAADLFGGAESNGPGSELFGGSGGAGATAAAAAFPAGAAGAGGVPDGLFDGGQGGSSALAPARQTGLSSCFGDEGADGVPGGLFDVGHRGPSTPAPAPQTGLSSCFGDEAEELVVGPGGTVGSVPAGVWVPANATPPFEASMPGATKGLFDDWACAGPATDIGGAAAPDPFAAPAAVPGTNRSDVSSLF